MVVVLCFGFLLTTISHYQVLLFSADFFNGLHYFYQQKQNSKSFTDLFDTAIQLSKNIDGGPSYLRMVIESSVPLNYPPLFFSANWLRAHFQSVPAMEALAVAMSIGALAATIPSLVLFGSFMLNLPRASLPPILAVLGVIAVLPLFPGRPPLALPEPLVHPALRGLLRGESIIVLLSLALAMWVATTVRLEPYRSRCAHWIDGRIKQISTALIIAAILTLLIRLVTPPSVGLELAGLILSMIAAVVIGTVLRLPPLAAIAAAFISYSAIYVQYSLSKQPTLRQRAQLPSSPAAC